MSINAKSVEFQQCHAHAKPHLICFFHNIKDNERNLGLALHYANELLVRVRLSFQKRLQTRPTWRNNTKNMFKCTDHDKPQFHSYVFIFFTTISTSKKIARHIDASSVVWTLVIFDFFVLSMRMQVILDSLFARPGSAPIGCGKKGEFRDWTILQTELFLLQTINERCIQAEPLRKTNVIFLPGQSISKNICNLLLGQQSLYVRPPKIQHHVFLSRIRRFANDNEVY